MSFRSNLRHQRLLGGLLAIAAALLPSLAVPQAAQPAYRVEIIVFRATGGPGASEDWATSATKSARGPANEGERGGAAQVGRFVSRIPPAELQLGDLRAKLASSGAWQPLTHVGWMQTASSWGSRAGFTTGQLGINVPGLSGVVYLERGTFLHLGFGLRYAGASTYALNETRRVKFYERHYYDHPAFGVIALVTPAQGARPAGR
jgi:hypothetical protein